MGAWTELLGAGESWGLANSCRSIDKYLAEREFSATKSNLGW